MIALAVVLALIGFWLLAWVASSLVALQQPLPDDILFELLRADDRIADDFIIAHRAMTDVASQSRPNRAW